MTSSGSSISNTLDYFDWHQMVFQEWTSKRYIEHNGQFTIIMTILILQWHYTLELQSITLQWHDGSFESIRVCMQIIINWPDVMLHWNVPFDTNWLLDSRQPISRQFLLQKRDEGNENRICWHMIPAPIFPIAKMRQTVAQVGKNMRRKKNAF